VENLEEKFERCENVLDYFDKARVIRPELKSDAKEEIGYQ
jgi:hypothetical protein